MATNPRVRRLIRRKARKYGVDPRAAEAVAKSEGGVRWGSVGDGGTSFGPFQEHVGGALPRGRGARWANSPAGVDHAIRSMAQSGARGKKGRAAITAIVRNFERPANPDAEIARAASYYGVHDVGGGSGGKPSRRRAASRPAGLEPAQVPRIVPTVTKRARPARMAAPTQGAMQNSSPPPAPGQRGAERRYKGYQAAQPKLRRETAAIADALAPAAVPSVPPPPRNPGGGGGGVGLGGGGRSITVTPNHRSTHQTSGLSGYPAYDYMAPAGTSVRISEPVRVFRHSGKSPRLGGSPGGPMGYSVYAKGLRSGKTYFITHLGSTARNGTYKAGAVIGRVASNKWAPGWSSTHAHVGVHG